MTGNRCSAFLFRMTMERTISNPPHYSSRYFNAALTIIEKPNKKNEPAINPIDSASEKNLAKIDSMPLNKHTAPITLIALGTRLLSSCLLFFSINSSYRSYPDLGFSSIVINFYRKITEFFGMAQPINLITLR